MLASQAVTQIDGVNQRLTKELASNTTLLTETKTAMVQNVETLQNSLKALEARIEKLK